MPEDNQPPARSVADASIRAATRFEDVVAAARAYVLTAKLAAADGITWAEFGELLTGLLRTLTQAAELLTLPGPEKKAIVLTAAASLFDATADRCVSPWLWAFWLVIRPSVRSLVLAIAAGSVEQILPLVRSAET
jgi:hypothetical protein